MQYLKMWKMKGTNEMQSWIRLWTWPLSWKLNCFPLFLCCTQQTVKCNSEDKQRCPQHTHTHKPSHSITQNIRWHTEIEHVHFITKSVCVHHSNLIFINHKQLWITDALLCRRFQSNPLVNGFKENEVILFEIQTYRNCDRMCNFELQRKKQTNKQTHTNFKVEFEWFLAKVDRYFLSRTVQTDCCIIFCFWIQSY